MKAGILGYVHGEFDRIQNTVDVIDADGEELQRCIDIVNNDSVRSSKNIQVGEVAKEEEVKVTNKQIQEGSVQVEEAKDIEVISSEFCTIGDDLVILDTGSGTFGFDLIGRQAETLIERAELDLDSFASDHDEATFWQYGFYNSGLNAENGVLYGTDVEQDSITDSIIKSASANQIGIDYLYGDDPVKVKMAESGYVEVYQPSEWETEDFAEYVSDELLPYVRSP